ncbi:MAG: SHOCT domain-containing protein [Gammaproteobacteria bacterium]|jgi:putative membrane protein
MYEWHTFGGGVMWIVWILVVALLVWIVVTATRSAGGSRETPRSAREILDSRYANGEIDRDEYQQKRADLEK